MCAVEVTPFCENWAKVIVSKRGDTVAVKQVIAAYKLKVCFTRTSLISCLLSTCSFTLNCRIYVWQTSAGEMLTIVFLTGDSRFEQFEATAETSRT